MFSRCHKKLIKSDSECSEILGTNRRKVLLLLFLFRMRVYCFSRDQRRSDSGYKVVAAPKDSSPAVDKVLHYSTSIACGKAGRVDSRRRIWCVRPSDRSYRVSIFVPLTIRSRRRCRVLRSHSISRISGLSRGWIWRDSVELPDRIPDNPQLATGPAPAADLFQVTREEDGHFPGDGQPLRGKYVKIISVQEVSHLFRSPRRHHFAAPFAALEQWKSGKMSDTALWRQCFFDPPETFTVSATTGGN